MAFNVYEWRRNQLITEGDNSDNGGDDLKKYRKQVLQQLLSWYKTQNGPDPKMIKKFESEIGALNENEDSSSVIVKKIKDLTWEDVDGLALPTNSAGTLASMRVTKDLDSWKSKFKGDEAEMEVTIDRDADMWFNQVKIEKLTQSDPMGFQAKIDAKKGKRFGLDEIEGDDYHGYNEPMSQDDINNTYADDPGYNDKVAYLFNVLQGTWNMGKNNNKINNLDDYAKSVIEDLETRF